MRLPRLGSALLALPLALGGTLGAPLPAHAAEGWGSEPVISSAAHRQLCADFLFVGVRGSGEPSGFGETVTDARNGLKKQWKRDGRVRQVWLDYPAVAPQTLADVPFESLMFDEPMPSTEYFDSAETGADRLVEVLQDSVKRCPRERVILAGFSQGAQVITSALATVRPGDQLLAAILLGNPSHYPSQSVREIDGTAPLEAIGMGAYFHVTRQVGAGEGNRQKAVEQMLQSTFDMHEGKTDKEHLRAAMKQAGAEIPPEAYPMTYSVCLAGDMVCDSSKPMAEILVSATNLEREMNRTRPIHLSYKEQNTAGTIEAVAKVINTTTLPEAPRKQHLPVRTTEYLPSRPDWVMTASVALGALVVGFLGGLWRGRALGRRSAMAAVRRRLEASSPETAEDGDD